MQVPIKRLEQEFYPLRFPESMRGRRYSAIIFDGCNFDCFFCFESDKNPDGTNRPKLGQVDLNFVIDFALKEVRRGNPIEITGGEATLYPEALFDLVYAIKEAGGYVNLATNGSNPDIIDTTQSKIDCLGLDIKSVPSKIEKYTGVKRELGFENPFALLNRSKNYSCDVHFKRIMFKETTLADLEFFYPYGSHAYWILKQLRPFPSRGDFLLSSDLSLIDSSELIKIAGDFTLLHPNLKGKLISIAGGSGRNPDNYTYW